MACSGNVPGAAGAGGEQHRVHGQHGHVARRLQPDIRHRARHTISRQEVSNGRLAMSAVRATVAMYQKR